MSRPLGMNLPEREVTPKALYLNRRAIIAAGLALAACGEGEEEGSAAHGTPLQAAPSPLSTDEPKTEREAITSYNNFYEFGVDKGDPFKNAHTLTTRPWTVEIGGLCAHPQTFAIDDLLRQNPLQERIYRHRCVEGWSMVIPWIGFPLAALLAKVEPTHDARFVAFQTLERPEEMPGQRGPVLNWPYREGLTIQEAMNPLALLAVGLYGETLLNQNGAPIRLVVPWKYGFKSIKSIVRIDLVAQQPHTAWNDSAPNEYGFLSNVNPEVDHPRWSQATERRIGEFRRRPTLMFNGYGDYVADLYRGVDLRRNF